MCEQAPVHRFSPLLQADRLPASAHQHTRYKTPPTRPRQQPNRYKTLPTRPKRPISASFARAGRTFYRTQHHDPQQGELCTAPSAKPGTKLSQRPRQQPNRYKTLPTRPKRPISASFARAGRTFYRTQHHDPQQGELCTAPSAKPGTKLSQRPRQQPNRYKTLPTRPKRPISARFTRAGRTFYRTQHHDAQQGELCTVPSAKPGTKLPQHARASSPPGTKLSQCPRSTAVPRKSSPSTPHTTTEPRKSSPSTPKNGVFRLFRACRANFFALTPTSGRAGRTYSRRGLDRTR